MDMKLRKVLRDFINWQGKNDLLKNELTIDYELAETYLEDTNKQLSLYNVVVPEGTLSCDCPICGKEMTSQLVKHHHCKECKEHFTTT